MSHSSVIFEYLGSQYDSFLLSWECRRYFVRPEEGNRLGFVVSAKYWDVYSNFWNPDIATDAHCVTRGLTIGKDLPTYESYSMTTNVWVILYEERCGLSSIRGFRSHAMLHKYDQARRITHLKFLWLMDENR